MSDYVVIDHHHDPDGEVYRIVVGVPVIELQPVLDAQGRIERDADDNIVTEPVIVRHDLVEDFVFAADDKRWQDLDEDAIAAAQRAIIKEAIDARAPSVPDVIPTETTALPGIGDQL